MSVPRQYLTNAAAQALSRVLSISANLISLVMVARILGVDTFGQYAFIMAYVNIASSLADLGTTSVLARDLAQNREGLSGLYFGNFLYFRGTITLIATLLAVVAAPFLKPDLLWPLLLCSMAIPVIASRFFEPVYQVFDRPRYSVYASLCYAVSLLAVSAVVLVWLEGGLFDFLIGWVACNLIYTLVAFWLSARVVRPRFEIDRATIRRIAAFAAPLGVGAVFSIIHTRADVFLLTYLRSMQEVGHYSAAYKLLDMGSIMAITLLWPLIPILSRELKRQRAMGLRTARSVMELAALICFPLAVVAPYLARPAIQIIYGVEYAESASILGVLGLVFVILVFCLIGVVINLSVGKIRHAYWNTALAVAVNVSLNLVWIPRYGIAGAAYATLASHLCMLVVQQGYVLKNVGNLFRAGFWARVVGISLAMLLVLEVGAAGDNLYLVPVAVVVYVLLVRLLGLIPHSAPSGPFGRQAK
jgi:O-antigen/teichoic acid export membrane protein